MKVYIETSVVSYYVADYSRDIVIAGRQASTRDFWAKLHYKFKPVISALVIKEASQGDSLNSVKRLNAINGFEVIGISKKAEQLANLLIEKKAIPVKFPEDALHIAIATVERIDFIVTWNFKHINNPFTKKKIRNTIENFGYKAPILASPEQMVGE